MNRTGPPADQGGDVVDLWPEPCLPGDANANTSQSINQRKRASQRASTKQASKQDMNDSKVAFHSPRSCVCLCLSTGLPPLPGVTSPMQCAR